MSGDDLARTAHELTGEIHRFLNGRGFGAYDDVEAMILKALRAAAAAAEKEFEDHKRQFHPQWYSARASRAGTTGAPAPEGK